MIKFLERCHLTKQYEKWMNEHSPNVKQTPQSFLLWLHTRGMINENKVKEFLK